jgi:hypothetical protein
MTAYIPIAHLACIMHPSNSKEKLLYLLTAYMDESGHSADPAYHFAAMAGFVAPLKVWEVVGDIWERVCKWKPFELQEPFHMKDFAHFKGQFEGWDEQKRKALYGRLVQIITLAEPTPSWCRGFHRRL